MGTVAVTVKSILEPYIGPMIADTCVRASALSIGKLSDDLEPSDLPVIEQNLRRALSPVASAAVVDDVIAQIERSLR